jgi:Tfp pilus assembly protein PilP
VKTSQCSALLWLSLGVAACVDDGGAEVSAKRGAPPPKAGGAAGAPAKAAPAAPAAGAPAAPGAAADGEEEVLPSQLPARPPVALDAKSFQRRRDPFLSFVASEVVVPEPDRPRAERKVEMQQYAFEDLKLVAIVNAGRGMKPRALFVASDGKSHSIKQGDYFSSAEVLLAAVNRDYVEIEVVDDDLASSLNLQRGERRAIYLRNE